MGITVTAQVMACCLFALTRGQYNTAQLQYFKNYSDHPCVRPCQDGESPRHCVYDFYLELYFTLSKACFQCPFNLTDCTRPYCVPADGTSRGILTANRMLPGPAIEVCEGDVVAVNVHNEMGTAAGTSIHWHGLLQRGTPYMDGVASVTQCSIPFKSTFQYRFTAQDPGTYWWHSHSGPQRADGLYGHFVVRQSPSRDPHSALYDYDLPEHVISVSDWLVEMTANRFASHHHNDGDNKPASMLINGKGAFQEFTDPETGNMTFTPYAEFKVKPDTRYRFRVISAAILNCPIQFSIDDHNLMIIASDGGSFDPIVVDSFNIFAGERFDFVLITQNTTSPQNHWIRVRGLADCSVKKAHQLAVLRYEGSPESFPTSNKTYEDGDRLGRKLNPWNTRATDTLVSVDRLDAVHEDDDSLKEAPDKKFYLAMDFHKIDSFHFHTPGLFPISSVARNKHLYSPQINHISLTLPRVPPLSQFSDLREEEFCNSDNVQVRCDQEFCECVHRLQVALNDVVEIVLIDEGVTFDANHPMHLHGFKFRVVGLDRLNKSTSLEEVKALDRAGLLKRKLTKAPLKDTVTVPDGGYTIIRFKADNPGVWLMHCHIDFHVEIGMGVVIQVGDPSQFPPRPKHFPTCRDWTFQGYEDDDDDNDDDGNGQGNNNSGQTKCPVSDASRARRVGWGVVGVMVLFCGLGLLK